MTHTNLENLVREALDENQNASAEKIVADLREQGYGLCHEDEVRRVIIKSRKHRVRNEPTAIAIAPMYAEAS